MGKALYEAHAECREIFDAASDTLGYDLKQICFEKNDKINSTQYSQPALLTVSMMANAILSQKERADMMMGLSLGEYSALTAAGAFELRQALLLVKKRGELMSGAVGAMTAVIGLKKDRVEALCADVPEVYLANYNTPEQIVIAGKEAALPEAEKKCKEAGGKCMRLKVSGPFHTPLLKDIAAEFNQTLEQTALSLPNTPIITNVTGDLLPESTEGILENLKVHMLSPVNWVGAVEKAISLGAGRFIELGAGKTLCSFVKKINADVEAYTAEEFI